MAALVPDRPNVFVHFSLDRDSMARKAQFLRLPPQSSNYFFSYQVAPGETPPQSISAKVSVIFFHNYEPNWPRETLEQPEVCPLNTFGDIADVCEKCRRCFNGTAVLDARIKNVGLQETLGNLEEVKEYKGRSVV
jgi:hypothetical protein